MVSPSEHYRAHRATYDHLWEKTATTGKIYADSDFSTKYDLLDKAIRFALLSAQTKVPEQEKAYRASLEVGTATTIRRFILESELQSTDTDQDDAPRTFNTEWWKDEYDTVVFRRARDKWAEMAEAIRAAGVNYANNKAAYIIRNSVEPDYKAIIDHWTANENDEAHRLLADEFLGVGLPKAAYSMGKLGCEEKLCIDRHVAQAAGIDQEDRYTGTVVERYEADCETVETAFPELSHLPRLLFRWIVFDASRYTEIGENPVTTHDVWFDSLPL